MMRVNEGLNRTGRTALRVDTVELLVDRDSVSDSLLSRAIVPLPDDFDHLKLLSRFVEYLVKAVMPVAIDGISGRAAHLKEFAGIALDLLQEPTRSEASKFNLVDIDRDCVRRLDHVVE